MNDDLYLGGRIELKKTINLIENLMPQINTAVFKYNENNKLDIENNV